MCRISNLFGLSTTEETQLVKMHIWCINIGIVLKTYDTFSTFSSEKNFQPPPLEEFLEINFQFFMASILHR
jgi:hypothetical protein